MADWWTPTGMEIREAPEGDGEAPDFDLDRAQSPKDWMHFTSTDFTEDDSFRVVVGRRPLDEMLVVSTWTSSLELTRFFVAGEWATTFMLEKYPELLLTARQIAAAEKQIAQANAHIAFIRHGQGRSTISQDGMRDNETMIDDQESAKRRQERTERQKRGG